MKRPAPPSATAFFLWLVLSLSAGTSVLGQAATGRQPSPTWDAANHRALSNAPRMPLKRIAAPRAGDSAEGSRVRLTSDAALDDYSAHRAGDRFYVRIPHAEAAYTPTPFSGSLFSDARVEQRGDDLLLSFRLSPGVAAHVVQNFNHLDVVFTPQDQQKKSGGETPSSPSTSSPASTAADPQASPSTPTPTVMPATASAPKTEKPAGAKGATAALPPEKATPARITRFEKPPVIDGKLDDDAWKSATVFKDFLQIEPGDNIAPSQPTEVLLGYDARFIYIAFRAFDEKGKVRATVAKRDNVFDDDNVGVFFDTFNDKRKAYEFVFNPLGVQADAIYSNGDEDFSVDVVMESKGALTDDGYVVEVAVPFKSLRYEAGKGKLWGLHFFRHIKRFNNETDSWMPISRDVSGVLIQAGHLTGLEDISTERTLEIIPSITLSENGKRGRNTFGLLLASDSAPGNFSEDEREILQRNPKTLTVDEKLEREHLLKLVDKNATIGILRLKRDVGKESSIGLFATSYNFPERINHLFGFDGRFKIDPKTVTRFEIIATTSRTLFRDLDRGGELFRKGNGFAYSYQWDYTGRNYGYVFNARGRTRDYRADVGFTERTNTNNAQFAWRYSTNPKPKATFTSFRFQNFNNSDFDWQGRQQGWISGQNFDFNFIRQTFLRLGTNFGYERVFEEEFGPRRSASRPCDATGADINLPEEDRRAPCAFFGEDTERSTRFKSVFIFTETTPSKKFSPFLFIGTRRGVFDFDFGAGRRFPRVSPGVLADPGNRRVPLDPGPGNTFDIQAGITLQPTDAWRTSISYNKARLTRQDTGRVAFDDNIYVVRSTYQFTRFLFARARVDYETLSSNLRGQFLFGWTPNPGTSFYVGYNDDLSVNGFSPFNSQLEPGFRRNGRLFFIKASYLFRRSF
ncbi:MAG: hypothetical protein LC754_14940 [Acidobacteria bacterium]|nr:hypothetical protein [Acidobacteriota bacterium]